MPKERKPALAHARIKRTIIETAIVKLERDGETIRDINIRDEVEELEVDIESIIEVLEYHGEESD